MLKGGDRITSQDIKRAQTVLKGKSKNEWTALRTTLEKQKKAKEALTGKSPSYLTGKEKAKEHKEKYPSLMEQQIKSGTFYTNGNTTGRKEPMKYTGTLVKGIATMHKSNAVPVISQEEATDIANMRRN